MQPSTRPTGPTLPAHLLIPLLASTAQATPLSNLFKRVGNNDNPDDGTNTNAIIGYAIGGTACVLILFIVAYAWFRKHARMRDAIRMRAQDTPAVRAAGLRVYAREQEQRLRSSNAKRWAGSSAVPLRSPGVASEGGSGVVSEGATPPPSYFDGAGAARLPRYPSDRALRR